MSEEGLDGQAVMDDSGKTIDDDCPKFDLFIRASLIDNESQGACPMSQQGFMLCYILAQEKNCDFKVFTVSQVNPPADFLQKNVSRIFPWVEGQSGKDTSGRDIAGIRPESADSVDDFFESINTDCPHLIRPKNLKNHILGKIDGISTQFNTFMKRTNPERSEKLLLNTLQKVEDHLGSTGTTFLDGDMLSYVDCFFLPRLHHIVIAGGYFWGLEIPSSLKNLWRYLRDCYETPAFCETLPFDEDLLKFHYERLPGGEQAGLRKRGIKGLFGVDANLKKTCHVPDNVIAMLDGKSEDNDVGANGDVAHEQELME